MIFLLGLAEILQGMSTFQNLNENFYFHYYYYCFRLSKIYDKIEKHCDTVKPFTTKEYIFDFTNTKSVWKAMSEDDRKLFKFVMEDFDWPSGLEVGYRGTRQFLLKEDPATIPQAKRKFKILQFIHYSFLILLVVLIIYLIYSTIVLL